MINFEFVLTNPDNVVLKKSINEYGNKYPEILDVCGEFRILVEGNIFFNEPQFPVVELVVFFEKWIKSKRKAKGMQFNSIETEDNPLIQFKSEKDKFCIFSPWQLFECHELFTKNEIMEAFHELKKSVDEQIQLLA